MIDCWLVPRRQAGRTASELALSHGHAALAAELRRPRSVRRPAAPAVRVAGGAEADAAREMADAAMVALLAELEVEQGAGKNSSKGRKGRRKGGRS